MDRGASSHPLTWLTIPVAGLLVTSALTLPFQPYTGVQLRGDVVADVTPGSPAAAAGLAAGDRIWPVAAADASAAPDPAEAALRQLLSPFFGARPGTPITLASERAGDRRVVTLVPRTLPAGERHLSAALVAVASGFMLLGGWVWSERRDRLTRPFFLLSLAFAVLFAPPPALGWPQLGLLHDLSFTAAQLLLPALFVHFFALFPEPRAPRGRIAASVMAGYGVAALLFAASIATLALHLLNPLTSTPLAQLLSMTAALWFASGFTFALALFVRSYLRAGGASVDDARDARRRLRVALAGTALGLAPLVTLIVIRNLSPTTEVPGERGAVLLVLLVPISFAWAIGVHRIFDFRVALRAATVAGLVALMAAGLFWAGEWLTIGWGQPLGIDLSGWALGLVALAASLAGPARPVIAAASKHLIRAEPPALATRLAQAAAARSASAGELLERACEGLVAALRLDRCAAVEWDGAGWRLAAVRPAGTPGTPVLDPHFGTALTGRPALIVADDERLSPGSRDALEAWGARWVLPVSSGAQPVAALLLGRRLAGAWLDRREMEEVERFAAQLAVALENFALRRAARSHGEIDREIERAGAIQARLLPRRAPIYPTLDCAAATLSNEPVGGDYYDFVESDDREFTLAVGDAAGKGVPAALLLAGVQARFRHEAIQGRDPSAVLGALNRELVHLDQPEKFVGLLCARVDVRRGRVWFANAGLMPPLVHRRSGSCEEITAGGLLLGVRAGAEYTDTCVQLRAGDVALICTDGLTEASRDGELYGLERVRRVLDVHAHRRAGAILEAILEDVHAFTDGPLDDLTVLVLRQLADPPSEAGWQPAIPLQRRFASAENPG